LSGVAKPFSLSETIAMALDVYVVDGVGPGPAAGFASCSFVDRDHDYIFHGAGIDIYN
jgi:hypothetical protein